MQEAMTEKSSKSTSNEIVQLAQLREAGTISEEEFKAYSERFTKSSAEKASEAVDTISKLHAQFKEGAMSEGNYRSNLWSLMDKIERS